MSEKVANKQAICEVLMEKSRCDQDIYVVCSDSRGSASLAPFADEFPEQFVEIGIAEQNLVSLSAGMASTGKKVFAVSPACFLSTRSMEQAKVDVAYSNNNVKLVGISGGISYGALGMTHHSAQDIAAMAAIPNMRVYIPSDDIQTKSLINALLEDNLPAYVRVGRNAVDRVYDKYKNDFVLNKSTRIIDGNDVAIFACGEMVSEAVKAGELLSSSGISTRVVDMHCIKPIDKQEVIDAAKTVKAIVTIEEHSYLLGMGAMIDQIVCESNPILVKNMGLPDSSVIAGNSREVFDHYGLNADGIIKQVKELI